MADGKEAKVRWTKSEKHRRIRRRESWAKEEKEIKELEDRCRDVSCCLYSSLCIGFATCGNELIFWHDSKHYHVLVEIFNDMYCKLAKIRNNNTKLPKRAVPPN